MWERIVEEVRKAGPRKVAVLAIAAAVAVALAYGVNSTNDAANGRTLPASHAVRTALPVPPVLTARRR